jgi:hypothetical protein
MNKSRRNRILLQAALTLAAGNRGLEEKQMKEPIQILSLGAGVQSSTLALMAAAGEITPMPVAAIFADTQAEPASVYRWLDWLEKQLPFPVIRVSKGSLQESALTVRTSKKGNTYTNSNVPAFLKTEGVAVEGLQMRQCTKDFKIDVILREVRKIARAEISEWRKAKCPKEVPVIQWMGISRDEVYRMKPSRLRYVEHRWPLIDMNITRAACMDWMKKRGFPTPPRSACVFCPYHGDIEWLKLKTEEPEEFERAAQFEDAYQVSLSKIQRRAAVPYLHRSLLPIRTIDFATRVKDKADIEAQQPDLFGNECEGMCGV